MPKKKATKKKTPKELPKALFIKSGMSVTKVLKKTAGRKKTKKAPK